jgi:nucleolar GTP-binding protein
MLADLGIVFSCRDKSGLRDASQAAVAQKRMKMHQRPFAKAARQGESDRRILASKPKHLFAGKRKMGKTGRR